MALKGAWRGSFTSALSWVCRAGEMLWGWEISINVKRDGLKIPAELWCAAWGSQCCSTPGDSQPQSRRKRQKILESQGWWGWKRPLGSSGPNVSHHHGDINPCPQVPCIYFLCIYFPYIYPCIYPYIYTFIYPYIYPRIYLSTYLSMYFINTQVSYPCIYPCIYPHIPPLPVKPGKSGKIAVQRSCSPCSPHSRRNGERLEEVWR